MDPSHHHPNPAHTKLTKTLQKQRQARAKELAKYGHTYQSQAHQSPAEQAILLRKLQQLESSPAGAKLRALNAQISQTEAARDALAERENTSQAGYKKLRSGIKQITTHIVLCAYDLESELYRLLEGGYANWYKDGRAVIAAALKSRGKLSYEKGKLIIELEAQSSPVRTRAINSLIEQLNQTPSHYPGTDLEIELRPTPLPK